MILEDVEEYGKPVIYHWYRQGQEKKCNRITELYPYFFILRNEKDNLINEKLAIDKKFECYDYKNDEKTLLKSMECIKEIDCGNYKSIFGDDCIKLIVKKQKYMSKLRVLFSKTFENDVTLTNRLLIDYSTLNYGDMPRICFIDIEVEVVDNKFPDVLKADKRITAISLANNYDDTIHTFVFDSKVNIKELEIREFDNKISGKKDKWYVYKYDSEIIMLKEFLVVFNEIDAEILSGYNCDFFDYPYLIRRLDVTMIGAENLSKLKKAYVPKLYLNKQGKKEQQIPRITGRRIFDLYMAYRKLNASALSDKKLGTVATSVLGLDKIEYRGNLEKLYKEDKEKFILYNATDVFLTRELDRKLKMIPYFFAMSKFLKCQISSAMSSSQMVDMVFMQEAHNVNNIVLPSRKPVLAGTYEGAYVLDPKKGLYKNILVLDLNRLYPSICVSFGLSPETIIKDGEIKIENGTVVTKKYKGLFNQVLEKFFKVRIDAEIEMKKHQKGTELYDYYKNVRQFAKDLVNSSVGVLAYEGNRMYVKEIGATVTFIGRKIIKYTIKKLEDKGYNIIYGDTDSVLFQGKGQTKEELQAEGEQLAKEITESYDEFVAEYNLGEHCFSIKFEKIGARGIFYKKKKYCLLEYDGNYTWKGFESRRSDNSKFTKNLQRTVIEWILNGATKKQIDDLLVEKLKELPKASLEELGIPRDIKKKLIDYKGGAANNAHLRACRYSNQHLGQNLDEGNKPKLVYIKKVPKGYPDTDVVAFLEQEEIPAGFVVDEEKMRQRLVHNNIEKLYAVLGWEYSAVKNRVANQSFLQNFF